MTNEENLILKWWNGWYLLGWRGRLALWLIRGEVEGIARYMSKNPNS